MGTGVRTGQRETEKGIGMGGEIRSRMGIGGGERGRVGNECGNGDGEWSGMRMGQGWGGDGDRNGGRDEDGTAVGMGTGERDRDRNGNKDGSGTGDGVWDGDRDRDRDRDGTEPIPHFLQHKRETIITDFFLSYPKHFPELWNRSPASPAGFAATFAPCPRVRGTRAGSCSLPPLLARGSPHLPAHSLCFCLSWRSLN